MSTFPVPDSPLFEIINWLLLNRLEIIATLSGLIYLFYSVKGSKLLWPYGLLTSALYVYVFFQARIYADMGINIYYVIISIYGWYFWTVGKRNDHIELPVIRADHKLWILLSGVTLVVFFFIVVVLKNYTDSDIPYWDSFTTAGSIVATWMLARKILEHWLIWIIVDAVSVGLYIYKGLYPTVFLFLVYTTMAILGYIEWKRKWKSQELVKE